jgi:hypothetical protein
MIAANRCYTIATLAVYATVSMLRFSIPAVRVGISTGFSAGSHAQPFVYPAGRAADNLVEFTSLATASSNRWQPRGYASYIQSIIDRYLRPKQDKLMDWVLFVSLQWIVYGSPTQPTTQQIQSFQTEELCTKAAEAVRTEINAPIASGRVQTVGRVVCLLRKDKWQHKQASSSDRLWSAFFGESCLRHWARETSLLASIGSLPIRRRSIRRSLCCIAP